MIEWISVNDHLPDEPDIEKTQKACELKDYCPQDECKLCSYKEYLTTVVWVNGGITTTCLQYAGNGKWVDGSYQGDYDVLAWAVLPEPWKDTTKYRWKLNPYGWGGLRQMYLTAVSPVLMVADWDGVFDNSSQKNVFTEDEYKFLAEHWEFDESLFVKEEIPKETEEEA